MAYYVANSKYISVQNDVLRKLIAEGRLKNISLTVKKNCCDNLKTGASNIEIETPSLLKCKYKVKVCASDGTFIHDGRLSCDIDHTISHTCFLMELNLAYFDGVNPITGCSISVWVDGVIVNTETDDTGHALVYIPVSGNGDYNIEITCCGNKTKRFTYNISDCVGTHTTVPFPPECINGVFTKIRDLYIYFQGNSYQILNRIYDVSIPSELILLNEAINRWLKSNCRNGEATVKYDSDSNCYEIEILNTSSTVVPVKIVALSDYAYCFLEKKFSCLHYNPISICESTEYTKCNKFEISIPLLNNSYHLNNIVVINRDCSEDYIPLTEGSNNYVLLNYDGITGMHVGNLGILISSISSYYSNQGISVNVEATSDNSVLNITIDADVRLYIPSRIFINNVSTGILEDYSFKCTKYDYSLTDCKWTVRFETMNKCGYIQYGYLTEKKLFADVPYVVDQDSFYLTPDNVFFLKSKIEALYYGSYVDITRHNGIGDNSILEISISSTKSIPHSLILFDSDEKLCYMFSCENMTYANGTNDCRNNVTVTNDSIYIYPSIIGKSEFSVGIYEVNVTIEDNDGNTYNTIYCVANIHDIECILADVIKNNPESKAVMLYSALLSSKDCDQCDCDVLCNIFKALANDVSYSNKNIKAIFNECNC